MLNPFATLLPLLAGVCLSLSAACSSPSLTDEDIEAATQGAEAIALVGDDRVFVMTISALGMVKMNRGSRCSTLVSELAGSSPETYSARVAQTLMTCNQTCPKDLSKYGTMPHEQKQPTAIRECDAIGPDPLFTGSLAEQRKDFELMDYLLIRLHMDWFVQAVEKNGGDAAKAALKGYQDQAGRLANDMKRRRAANLKEMEAYENEASP